MQVTLLKSKIHRAIVTGSSLHDEGGMTISSDLAAAAGLRRHERILVGNIGNGERFETCVILGKPGAGVIELNGATAHLGEIGDRLTIMSFGTFTDAEAEAHTPRMIVLDEKNQPVRSGSPEPEPAVTG